MTTAVTVSTAALSVASFIAALSFFSAGVRADFTAVNVSKNLPAQLSTKWAPTDNPVLGNNGDTGGSYLSGSRCVHAGNGDPEPWWMLDMQQVRLISGVRVWNRVDCCAEKFRQITIGLSSNATVWSNFSLSLFDVCYYYAEAPTAAQNPLSFICRQPVAGRYLVVHKNVAGMASGADLFHLCEVDVFAYVKSQPYSLRDTAPSFSNTAAASLTEASLPMTSRSVTECAVQCGSHPICLYALYSNRQCHQFLSPVIPSSFRDAFIASGAAFVSVVG